MVALIYQQRLRMDVGFGPDDTASLSDEAIDALFAEAGEIYTDPASASVYTRVIFFRRLLVQAANEVDYVKNRSQERASQRYDHLKEELERWQDILDYVYSLSPDGGTVRGGKPQVLPPQIREYPYGYKW